jgi:L-ascorbate metabolism protein UlaG (beta-lactamase superfamily)
MRITWFGQSAVRLENAGHVILIDPFLTGNPKFTGDVGDAARGATHVVLTHGHDDHVGDTVRICKETGATLVATAELAGYLMSKGVEKAEMGNPGGGIDIGGGVRVNFVKAFHSSSTQENGHTVYLGAECGIVIEGLGRTVYHMGDTDIFGDMDLIQEIFEPKIGFVPIGDRFTMGPKIAALACKKYFKFDAAIPIHYGTFPILAQDPAPFVAAMEGQNVKVAEIGQPFEM